MGRGLNFRGSECRVKVKVGAANFNFEKLTPVKTKLCCRKEDTFRTWTSGFLNQKQFSATRQSCHELRLMSSCLRENFTVCSMKMCVACMYSCVWPQPDEQDFGARSSGILRPSLGNALATQSDGLRAVQQICLRMGRSST